MLEQILLFIFSFMANTLSVFAGGGVGLLQLPALATHKLATATLNIGTSLCHGRERNLEFRFIVLLILAGVPGVLVGTQLVSSIPDRAGMFALGL